MKKVTLKDIANELNITVGAVSHVMNGIDDISEETKKKVLETADRLGYISNSSAASLRLGKTFTIAVIVPDISNPHIAQQIKLIEDKLSLSGYSIIILNTNEDNKSERSAIVSACSKQVDGILICPTQHSTDNIEFLEKIDIPFILIGRYFAEYDTDYVCADDVKSGYLAGKYLAEKSYTNPLYIGAYEYIEASRNRFEGLKNAFSECGTEISSERFVKISSRGDNVSEVMEKLAADNISFDSIVAFSDLVAFEVMSVVKNVPVIGFDAINTHLHMPFSGVSIGMVDGGWAEKAASSLLKKISGYKKRIHEIIDVKLYEF